MSFLWFGGGLFERRKEELGEEIRAHIAMDVQARMERGEPRQEAEAAARREFGNVALVRDVTHGQWRWNRLEGLLRDLAYAVRMLRRASAADGMDVDRRASGWAGTGVLWQSRVEEFSLRGEAGRSLDAGCGDLAIAGGRIGCGLLACAAGGDGGPHGGAAGGVGWLQFRGCL
jgi:hypothetical protein